MVLSIPFCGDPVKGAPGVTDYICAAMESDGSYDYVLSKDLMDHSSGNCIQTLIRACVVWKVSIDVDCLIWIYLLAASLAILDEILMMGI